MKIYPIGNNKYLNTDTMPDSVYDYWYGKLENFKEEVKEISEDEAQGLYIITWGDFYGK